jgi:hypothetical protein
MAAVARKDPARAEALIAAERNTLSQRPGGLPPLTDSLLRAREFEAAWLSGDVERSRALAMPGEDVLKSPRAVRDNEALIVLAAQAATQDGRAREARRPLEALLAHWPDGHTPKRLRLRMEQVMAEVQLAAEDPAAARDTAQALAAMIEKAQGVASQNYRAALSVVALAAARAGDPAGARQALNRLASLPALPFASVAERADIELRQAQALELLGRTAEAAGLVRRLLPGLTAQHALSPRLAWARRLTAGG